MTFLMEITPRGTTNKIHDNVVVKYTMAKLLSESGSAPVKSGSNWRAVLITPGKGSSGFYPETMLREYGPTAFPKGAHSYVDHPNWNEDGRSPKNLMGVLAEDAYYEDGVGLVAELTIMPHWKEFVEAVAPHTGLSIYAMGSGDFNDEGEMVVQSLEADVQNSVDLVSYAGRPGSKLAAQLYEAAAATAYKNVSVEEDSKDGKKGTAAPKAVETVTDMKEGNSDMELKELSDQLAELPKLVAAAVAEALAPVVESEEDKDIDIAAVVEALVAADIPDVSRKAVYESLRAGVDLTQAIENQKVFVESVKSHLKEEADAAAAAAASGRRVGALIVNESASDKGLTLSDILQVKIGA
jgi:hypothetical protein